MRSTPITLYYKENENMKQEHKTIIALIEKHLEKNPSERFGQALFNLKINQFEESDKKDVRGQLRDIYADSDTEIISRIRKSGYFK